MDGNWKLFRAVSRVGVGTPPEFTATPFIAASPADADLTGEEPRPARQALFPL